MARKRRKKERKERLKGEKSEMEWIGIHKMKSIIIHILMEIVL